MEAAARRLSASGYAGLVLERVALDAGYTRGAVYHQFSSKEDLALAVVEWVGETWNVEVAEPSLSERRPVDALLAMARAHAIFCRREIARVMVMLRVEFVGQDHPIGHAVAEAIDAVEARCAELIAAGRQDGTIPQGPPTSDTATAYLAVLEAVGIHSGGRPPYDVELAERAARGVLGLPPSLESALRSGGDALV